MLKKYLVIGLLSITLFLGLAKGASSGLIDFINNLGENILFGYIEDTVSVDDISSSKITFKSPFILDGSGSKITKYRIMYSPKSLDEMEADTNLLSQSMEKQFTITDTSNSTFTMDLIATGDSLSGDHIYYALVIPEDNNGIFGELSNEICFKLDAEIFGEGNDCIDGNAATLSDNHNAGGADMSLANISFTKNGNTITLRWIAVDGSDEVEIFLWDRDDEEYTKLGTADMEDEEYSFTTNKNGEHRVKFIPDNGGIEHVYTFQVEGVGGANPGGGTPGVTKVPKVGPTENIAAIILFTLAIYLVYRSAKRHN